MEDFLVEQSELKFIIPLNQTTQKQKGGLHHWRYVGQLPFVDCLILASDIADDGAEDFLSNF